MCEDNIVIMFIFQSYVFNWHHTYLFHSKIYRKEAFICKRLYWAGTRKSVWKEVKNSDTCQRTNSSNKKYGRLPDKEAEEIP